MNQVQAFVYRALRRVQGFLVGGKLDQLPSLVALVASFFAALTELDQQIQLQETASQEAHSLSVALREQLRRLVGDHMRPIVHAAHVVFGPRSVEAAQFNLVSPRASLEQVLAAAGALAEAAAASEARLAAHGLKPDFLGQFRAATATARETADARERAHDRQVGATAGIAQAIADARTRLKLLDALISIELRGDGDRLAEWKSAVRVADAPGPHGKARGKAAKVSAGSTPETPAPEKAAV